MGREGESPLQAPQRPLLVRLFLGCQLLVALARVLLGHGPLSPRWTSQGCGVSTRGRCPAGYGAARLGPRAAGPTGTAVDLSEQARAGRVFLVVLQQQAASLLVEGRLGVGVDQQALDGLWGESLGSGARLQASQTPHCPAHWCPGLGWGAQALAWQTTLTTLRARRYSVSSPAVSLATATNTRGRGGTGLGSVYPSAQPSPCPAGNPNSLSFQPSAPGTRKKLRFLKKVLPVRQVGKGTR